MLKFVSSFALLALLFTSPAGAQTADTLSVTGRVVDPSGAAVPGAVVTLSANGQAVGAPVTTDQRGEFTFPVRSGAFTLTVSADGFGPSAQDIAVPAATNRPLTIALSLADLHETVAVTGGGGYAVPVIRSATKTPTPLIDVPQAVTVVTSELVQDQMMLSMGDAMRYVPGVAVHQGENNRDQLIIRGTSTSADFFIDGVRDDVQYYRDLYNSSRIEVLKGPNALIFGRGGGGGVVNRVEKEAMFRPAYEASFGGGMYDNKRFTTDLNQPINGKLAFRLNAMLEDSGSFRDSVDLTRGAVNPTLTYTMSDHTKVTASYEYLSDQRVADRGITSYQGRPVDVDRSTYFGNPDDSDVNADVNVGYVTVEHTGSAFTLRNHTSLANYDRGYQNYVPGAVSADGSTFVMTAYNNATDRTNFFNQTDLTYLGSTGALRHTVLVGAEFGKQFTDNFRNTGYFNNTATSITVPLAASVINTPVTFRQSATDADNHLVTNLAAAYAQDQVQLSRSVQVIGGLRFDHFGLTYHDNRTDTELDRPDNLVSPRAGVVYKPRIDMSVYGSYSVSYLPSSGDQFSSLTVITEQVKPERFDNYEGGFKWDVAPSLSFTSALYRLNRTNTRSTDPNDPTRIIQTGSTQTNGFEVGVNGTATRAWAIAGGYAYQNAEITSATTAAVEGKQVGQVPHHTLSLWNNYRFNSKLSAGLGIQYRSDMFVGVDNTVVLPSYVRVDAAAYYSFGSRVRLQMNLENLFDENYYINADSNTNISPGSPRAVRVGVTTRF